MNNHSNSTNKIITTEMIHRDAEQSTVMRPNVNDVTLDSDELGMVDSYNGHENDAESVVMEPTKEEDLTMLKKTAMTKRIVNPHQRWMTTVIGIVLCVCVVLGMFFYIHTKRHNATTISASSKSISTSTATTSKLIAMNELELHSGVNTDCWIIVRNKVYDITEWIPIHPGGKDTLNAQCGTDASIAFINKHPISYLSLHSPPINMVGKLRTIASTNSTTSSTHVYTNSTPSTSPEKNSGAPTFTPNGAPSTSPTTVPTFLPTMIPITASPVVVQTNSSITVPLSAPTTKPIATPTSSPTFKPIVAPTVAPSAKPITISTVAPTTNPILAPTITPTIFSTPCISIDEVMLHNVETDCYYILYDYVFDFTDYIYVHPGGPKKVLTECGTDATAVYETEKFHNEDLLYEVNAYDLYGLGYAC